MSTAFNSTSPSRRVIGATKPTTHSTNAVVDDVLTSIRMRGVTASSAAAAEPEREYQQPTKSWKRRVEASGDSGGSSGGGKGKSPRQVRGGDGATGAGGSPGTAGRRKSGRGTNGKDSSASSKTPPPPPPNVPKIRVEDLLQQRKDTLHQQSGRSRSGLSPLVSPRRRGMSLSTETADTLREYGGSSARGGLSPRPPNSKTRRRSDSGLEAFLAESQTTPSPPTQPRSIRAVSWQLSGGGRGSGDSPASGGPPSDGTRRVSSGTGRVRSGSGSGRARSGSGGGGSGSGSEVPSPLSDLSRRVPAPPTSSRTSRSSSRTPPRSRDRTPPRSQDRTPPRSRDHTPPTLSEPVLSEPLSSIPSGRRVDDLDSKDSGDNRSEDSGGGTDVGAAMDGRGGGSSGATDSLSLVQGAPSSSDSAALNNYSPLPAISSSTTTSPL